MRSEYPNGDRQSPTWRLRSGAALGRAGGLWAGSVAAIRLFAPYSGTAGLVSLTVRWGTKLPVHGPLLGGTPSEAKYFFMRIG